MRAKRPTALTRQALYRRVWSEPMSTVAKEIGVSGNALAKICNRLLVPYPSRGHWTKVNAGKRCARPPLPAAPEIQTRHVTISAARSASRRSRTRLDPSTRREQLLETAKEIICKEGLHAASMKRIAAAAGISETQAYNYFGDRDKLFVELASREYAKIRENRQAEIDRGSDHYSKVALATSSYLRQIGEKDALLHMLLGCPDVRAMLRKEHRRLTNTELPAHAQRLVDLYGIPQATALGCVAILSRLSVRAGSLIANKRISLNAGEHLCLAIVLHGSRSVVAAYGNTTRSQSPQAA